MKYYILLLVAAVLLSGCADKSTRDLEKYVQDAKQSTTALKVDPLPEFSEYKPTNFENVRKRDPFRQTSASDNEVKSQIHLKRFPDKNRMKGPLENFPVNRLTLVGIVQQEGKYWALIRNGDGRHVYSVKAGDYIGKNDGLIDKITSTEVFVTEIVKTPTGLWEEKKVELRLKQNEEEK